MAGLRSAGRGASSVFGDIDKKVAGTKKGLDSLGMSIKINVDMSGLDKAIRAVDDLGAKMRNVGGGSGGGGGFLRTSGAMFLGNMASQGVMMAGREMYGVAKDALTQGMDVEKNIVGLSTFVGEKRAQDIYTRLQGISAHTPYTTNQLLPIERGLISMGKGDKRAEHDMLGLANAVAATGGSDWALERMGWHLTQIAASGKVEGMQRREFAIAGIPYDKIMADYLGVKPGQVKGMSVSYDQLTGALDKASQKGGMFAGALDKLSQTIYGKATTIKDFWQIGLAKLTLSQKGNINALEDKIINVMTRFPEMISNITPIIDKVFSSFNELWPSVRQFGGGLMDILKPIGSALLSDGFKDLAKNMLDLSSAILKTIKPVTDLTGPLIEGASKIASKEIGVYKNAWNYLFDGDQYDRDNNPNIMTSRRQGYMWGTLPAGVKGSVDSIAMQHITDSLGAGNFFQSKEAMDGWQNGYMKKYYPKTAFDQNVLPLPYTTGAKAKGAKGAGAAGDETAANSDAIVGGGQRVINIHFRNFTEHFTVQSNGAKEGADEVYKHFQGMFARLMRSVPA